MLPPKGIAVKAAGEGKQGVLDGRRTGDLQGERQEGQEGGLGDAVRIGPRRREGRPRPRRIDPRGTLSKGSKMGVSVGWRRSCRAPEMGGGGVKSLAVAHGGPGLGLQKLRAQVLANFDTFVQLREKCCTPHPEIREF